MVKGEILPVVPQPQQQQNNHGGVLEQAEVAVPRTHQLGKWLRGYWNGHFSRILKDIFYRKALILYIDSL